MQEEQMREIFWKSKNIMTDAKQKETKFPTQKNNTHTPQQTGDQ